MNFQEIERYVLDGFVLNRRGEWNFINEVIEEEVYYFRHLENAEIIKDGKWIKIEDILNEEDLQNRTAHEKAENRKDPVESERVTDTQKIMTQPAGYKNQSAQNGMKSKQNSDHITTADSDAAQSYAADDASRTTKPQVLKRIEEVNALARMNHNAGAFDNKIKQFETNLAQKEQKGFRNTDTAPGTPNQGEASGASVNSAPASHDTPAPDISDDWDRARRGKYKFFIIPLAAILIAVIIILLIVL